MPLLKTPLWSHVIRHPTAFDISHCVQQRNEDFSVVRPTQYLLIALFLSSAPIADATIPFRLPISPRNEAHVQFSFRNLWRAKVDHNADHRSFVPNAIGQTDLLVSNSASTVLSCRVHKRTASSRRTVASTRRSLVRATMAL